MIRFPWHRFPSFELSRLASTDFFPTLPPDFARCRSLCIGTKSRAIGDALALTTLPRLLKKHYPQLRVTTFSRGFNPVVFLGNPHVDGVDCMPSALFGDDINWGEGQLITLKEVAFGLTPTRPPAPEIYLRNSERRRAQAWLRSDADSRPLLFLHPSGQTNQNVIQPSDWEALVRRWTHAYRIWQIGIVGSEPLAGCDGYAFLPKARAAARKLFALIREGHAFIGVDSGPMHVARAFGVRSLICTRHPDPSALFRARVAHPYFLFQNWRHASLYEENCHVPGGASGETFGAAVDGFLSNSTA